MTVRGRRLFYVPLLLLVACGGDSQLPSYDLGGSAMGTTFNITLVAPPADTDLDLLKASIYEKLEHIENIASTYRSESELSLFNSSASTDWITVTPELCSMISAAQEVSVATQGAFDITVGPLVNLWGFGPPQQDSELPTNEEIHAAQANVGYAALQTDCDKSLMRKATPGTYLDLSGWAKGYAVDEIAVLLNAKHLENYLVEIGGELRIRGHNAEQGKFSIALEKPLQNNDMTYTVLAISDVAVATSGDYRNFFMHDGHRYSHTIDPRTGRPVDHDLTAVTVVSTSTAFADAMATALLVLGPEDGHALAEKLGIAGYFLVRSGNGVEERSTSQFEDLRRM
ncbi:MAG: FAD:protein FMN transferase [Woeseiaceae bacterium]|nr:FAD:protein FMN transferase [Woeseiaceae bacterium]